MQTAAKIFPLAAANDSSCNDGLMSTRGADAGECTCKMAATASLLMIHTMLLTRTIAVDCRVHSKMEKKARWHTQRAQKEHAAEIPAHVGEYQLPNEVCKLRLRRA